MLIAALIVAFLPHAGMATEQDQLREQYVKAARSGEFSRALEGLQQLQEKYPGDAKILSDLLTVLVWAKQPERAIAIFEERELLELPEYAVFSLVLAYRNTGEYSKSEALVNQLLAGSPDNPEYQLKQIQLLIDMGELVEARAHLNSLPPSVRASDNFKLVEIYLAEGERNWIKVVELASLMEVDADNKDELVKTRIGALENLGAPFAAEKLIQQSSSSKAELARIYSLKAAVYLRWCGSAAKSEEEKKIFALKALSYQFQAISYWEHSENSVEAIRNIRQDMVVALATAGLHLEAYSLYTSLKEEGIVASYASLAAGNALLQLKKPEEAVELLEEVVEEEPDNEQTLNLLFYGYIESEEFSAAEALADKIASERPAMRRFLGTNAQYQNYAYLDGVVLSVLAKLYSDRLKEAWEEIEYLVEKAPANSWFRQVSGETALARSQPRRALKEFRTAGMLDPENVYALAGEGNTLIRLYDYEGVEKIAAKMELDYPLVSATGSLVKELELARSPQLWADFKYTYSEGPEQLGDSIVAGTEFISPPVTDNLRLSGHLRYSWSELPEGEEDLLTYGLGFEYTKKHGGVYGLLNYNESSVSEPGGKLRTFWTPDDHWMLSLDGSIYSDATPLRALFYGINMDKLGGNVVYRWDERRNLGLSLSGGLFSDDNERIEAGANLTQRIVDITRFDVDGTLSLYSSTNTREDAPYFNPEADFSGRLTFNAEHILYRHYDTSMVHDLSVGGGIYSQKGYDSDWVGNIRYEHRYYYTRILEGHAGVEVGRNVYDGEPEPYFSLNMMLHAKF